MLQVHLGAVGMASVFWGDGRSQAFPSRLTVYHASSPRHCPSFGSPREDQPAHGQVDSHGGGEVFPLLSHTLYNDSTVSPTSLSPTRCQEKPVEFS